MPGGSGECWPDYERGVRCVGLASSASGFRARVGTSAWVRCAGGGQLAELAQPTAVEGTLLGVRLGYLEAGDVVLGHSRRCVAVIGAVGVHVSGHAG